MTAEVTNVAQIEANQNATVEVTVLSSDNNVRTFETDSGSGKVINAVVGDETGHIRLTAWNGATEAIELLDSNESIRLQDVSAKEDDGLELHLNSKDQVERTDTDIEYDPHTSDISTVKQGDSADLSGEIVHVDDVHTFERDDGSEGQVRNIEIEDETGSIRVALWGEHADEQLDTGDYVALINTDIQTGYQDALEASVGWNSLMISLPSQDRANQAEPSNSTTEKTAGQNGLDNFKDPDQSAETGSESDADTETEEDHADDWDVDIYGDVISNGSPMVIRTDEEENYNILTDEKFFPGQTVQVRGNRTEGNEIDAVEVFKR